MKKIVKVFMSLLLVATVVVTGYAAWSFTNDSSATAPGSDAISGSVTVAEANVTNSSAKLEIFAGPSDTVIYNGTAVQEANLNMLALNLDQDAITVGGASSMSLTFVYTITDPTINASSTTAQKEASVTYLNSKSCDMDATISLTTALSNYVILKNGASASENNTITIDIGASANKTAATVEDVKVVWTATVTISFDYYSNPAPEGKVAKPATSTAYDTMVSALAGSKLLINVA